MHYTLTQSLLTILIFFDVFFVNNVNGLASTDTITWGGSNDRTGYQNNHNMDPAIVGSAQFGLLFKTNLPGTYLINGQNVPEQIFSQPLVYTGSDDVQYVYVATTQNNVYKINAKSGVIVASRNLHRPFLVSDLNGCVDINPTVGVTATGVIDPDTDTWYITAKTYINQDINGPTGRPNGRYYVHAISTVDLSERPNFPVNLEGMVARNNPVRSFNGGIHHQRPGLLHTGDYVYAGFASHCVQWNFTGWIVGWHKQTGQLVERFATEGAGVGPDVPGAGVWMSGGGLASDGKGSMFFASGNGYASQLNGVPVNGRNPPTALEEAAVHMSINSDGSLTIVDFFMPWEKVQLDGADKDLGTSPLELLPSQFSCGNITRMGVVTGKSGKTYWLNLDNLGGYQNGPNKLDNVIQVYQNENSVYAGAGVYPLEGGYIYINVIQYQTHVFKFSCDNGIPYFNKIADSPEKNAYVLGVGHGTVTSLNDQPGSGLLWTSDVEGSNLRIYNAVPENGLLNEINSFVTPGTTKFTRPVFGDGIVYQGTTLGYLYAYGAPVNLALTCTSPQFGTTNLNATSSPMPIQCQANTALTVTAAILSGNANFAFSGLPTLPFAVNQGQNFSFQATFTPQTVGPLSSSIILNTTQQAAGFSINTPVNLKGTGQSQAPLLMITPNTVSWNGVITGQVVGGVNQSVVISNLGNSQLSITGISYSVTGETGPWTTPNGTQAATVVSAFTFYNMPSSVAANSAVTIPINFNPSASGNYAVFVKVDSNGGSKVFDVLAAGSDQPKAVLEFQTPDGGWLQYRNGTPFSFGNVTENTTRYLKLRLSNNGTANAAPISVTVSKPPFGVSGLIGSNNNVDLAEGTLVYAGQNQTATLYCSVPKSQINVDPYNGTAQWTMNLNDPSFGKQFIQFSCNAVAEQAPPLNPLTQQGIYRYAGCFKENNPGRQLQTNIYSGSLNTNEQCIKQCSAAGYIFAGTQYTQECWCGYNRPSQVVDDANCNFACTGSVNEVCGGNGVRGAGSFISLFGDVTRWNGNTTDAPGPYINPGVLGFNSVGCYTEGSQTRALNVQPNSNNTVAGCIQACQGYLYAGVEYGGQCFCGNSLSTGAVSAATTDCAMACSNNQTELCGGPSRLNLYRYGNGTLPTSTPTSGNGGGNNPTQPTGLAAPATIGNFSYFSCYTEATAGRALSSVALADNSITLQTCASNCTQYRYFGVEYGRECYCGNTLAAGSVPATDGRCNMPCAGNSSLLCGGPSGLTLYNNTQWASTTTTPSQPTGPVTVPNAGQYQYVDCHTEATNGRALSGSAIASNDMTIQYCAGNCTGYTYFGVEYGRECYCGNTLNTGSVTATDQRCSMTCAGNSSTICGGPNGLSLYKLVAASSSSSSFRSSTSSTSSAPLSSTSVALPTSQNVTSTTVSALSSATSSFSSSNTTRATTSSSFAMFFSITSLSTTSTSSFSTMPTLVPSSTSLPTSTLVLTSSSIPSSTTSVRTTSSTNASATPSIGVSSSTQTSSWNSLSSSSSIISITSAPGILSSSSSMISTSRSGSSAYSSTSGSLAYFSSSTSGLTIGSSTPSTSGSSTYMTSTTSRLTIVLPTSASSGFSTVFVARTSTTSTTPAFTSSSLITTSASIQFSSTSSQTTSQLRISTSGPGSVSTSTPSSTTSSTFQASIIITSSSKLSVFSTSIPMTSSRTRLTSPTTISGSSSTSLTASSTTNPLLPNIYVGCAAELSNTRLLSSASTTNSSMTIESCLSFCTSQSLPLAGLEYGRECYCSSSLPPNTALNLTGCTMSCAGDSTQTCGGRSRLSIFNNTLLSPPGPKPVVAPGYTYQGCFTDPSSSQRTLSGYSTSDNAMTQEQCVGTCAGRGFKFAGVEYARECYCSDTLGTVVGANGGKGVQVSEGDCSMICAGDKGEVCGGSSRIGVWMAS